MRIGKEIENEIINYQLSIINYLVGVKILITAKIMDN
jgi:hypothetical protein